MKNFNYNTVPLFTWLLWHLMAVLTIVLIPSQVLFGDSLWLLPEKELYFLAGISLAYLLSVILLTIGVYKYNMKFLRYKLLLLLSVLGGYSFILLITKEFYSRPYLLLAMVLSVTLIFLPSFINQVFQKFIIVIFLVLSLVMQLFGTFPNNFIEQSFFPERLKYRTDKVISTDLYAIKASFFEKYFCSPLVQEKCKTPRNGGGISAFGNGFLLATGDGFLYSITLDKDTQSIETKLLPYLIPINSDDFRDAGYQERLIVFRVTDILVQNKGEGFRIYAAHHYYNTVDNCFSMRVSSIESNHSSFVSEASQSKWHTVYETKPCLPLRRTFPRSHNPTFFSGDESGGRLLLLNENNLLLSTGDHLFNGWDKDEMLAQDKNTSYGKTIQIELSTGRGKIYSMGHRNPQGLYADPDGNIWLTEHGPRGGDELNMLVEGANYGWPLVTYGTDYKKYTWPLNKNQGQHKGFQLPLFSWVPSIAISNLVSMEGELFSLWEHDFIIGSYSKKVWRVRVREGRVVYVEPINIRGKNARIRDVIEDKYGRIVLWLDSGTIVVLRPVLKNEALLGSPKQIFVNNCTGCHSIDDGADGIGPNLFGIVNRQVASVTDYNYSDAFAKKTGVWTEKKLNDFIANPQHFAPGTSMNFVGMSNNANREKIIDYLNALN